MDEAAVASQLPPVPQTEWVGPEIPAAELRAGPNADGIPSRKRFRSVKILRGGDELCFGLGDVVHLESGQEDKVPFVARVVALFEDEENGTKQFQAQWLYRPSDLPKPPTDLQVQEMFLTSHVDINRVEVVLETVHCVLIGPAGSWGVTRLSTDGSINLKKVDCRYVLRRVFDHITLGIDLLDDAQFKALEVYNDATATAALNIHVGKKKKSPASADSSGSKIKEEKGQLKRHKTIEPGVSGDATETATPSKTELGVLKDTGSGSSEAEQAAPKDTLLASSLSIEQTNRYFEHAVKCSNDECACAQMKMLLKHANGAPCASTDCSMCPTFYARLDYHTLRCKARGGSCRIPRCDEFKTAARLNHAINCETPECGFSSWCTTWKSILQHAMSPCSRHECKACSDLTEALREHETLCSNGLCLFPNCRVFAEVLTHGARTDGGETCEKLDHCVLCMLFKRMQRLHGEACSAKCSECRFPLCAGKNEVTPTSVPVEDGENELLTVSRTVETTSASSTIEIPGQATSAPTNQALPIIDGRAEPAATSTPQSSSNRILPPSAHHDVPIGSKYQATVPKWNGRPTTTPSNEEGIPLWTLPNTAATQKLLESMKKELAKDNELHVSKVIVVRVTETEKVQKKFMLSRIVHVPAAQDLDQTLLVVPYDAVWPQDNVDPTTFMSSASLPSRLVYRVGSDAIVPTETETERVMYTIQLRELEKVHGRDAPATMRLQRMLSEENAWKMSDLSSLETWTEPEFVAFCKAVRDRRAELSVPDIARRVGTKTYEEVSRMFYFHAHGVARAPSGFVPCTKCLFSDAVHACKQYFACRTALCASCYSKTKPKYTSAARQAQQEEDESDGCYWFCASCLEADRKSPLTTTFTATARDAVRVIEENDGYDDTVAFNSRLSVPEHVPTVVDAVATLDDILYVFPPWIYTLIVESLERYGKGELSRQELMYRFEKAEASTEGFAPTKPLIGMLQQFLPRSLRMEH